MSGLLRLGVTGPLGVVPSAGDPLPTDVWMITSANGGATWSEQPLSGPFDMKNAPFVSGGYFVGDYIGMTAVGSAFHPVWVEATSVDNVTDVYTTTVTP